MPSPRRFVAIPAMLWIAGLVPAQVQTVVLQSVADNTLWNDATGGVSNGSGTAMFCGQTGFNAVNRVRRALVRFDVGRAVPLGAVVLDATLKLRVTRSSGANPPVAVAVHLATASWGEGASVGANNQGMGAPAATGDATWLHRFSPGAFWTSPGGDFASVSSATTEVSVPADYAWQGSGLVADVQGWVDRPGSDHGWLLKTPEVVAFTTKRFGTREIETVAARPTLEIRFAVPPAVAITGTGCTGSNGSVFTLAAINLPALGAQDLVLQLAGGPSAAPGLLFVGAGRASQPLSLGACTVDLDVREALVFIALGVSPIGVLLDGAGNGSLPLVVPADPALAGLVLDLQAAAPDQALPGGYVTTNVLSLVFG